jgi:Uma2 family endonuclease
MANQLTKVRKNVSYPMSDGKPLADNTLQFDWIVKIFTGLAIQFKDAADVFVASNLIWYPVEGRPRIRTASNVMIAFGRPKGYRSSYLQWKEGGVAPQVVFKIYSPQNRPPQLRRLFEFYQRYGVEEYYFYNPFKFTLKAWWREGAKRKPLRPILGMRSPRLGVLFEMGDDDLRIVGTDGREFLAPGQRADREQAEREELLRQAREKERARYDAILEQMRAGGIDLRKFLGDS